MSEAIEIGVRAWLRRALALGLASLAGAVLARAQDEPVALQPGAPYTGELDLEHHPWCDFHLQVPKGAVLWRAKLTCSKADLDLYAGSGEPPEDPQNPKAPEVPDEAEYSAVTPEGVEQLDVDRLSDPAISAGPYWLRVQCTYPDVYGNGDSKTSRAPFKLQLEYFQARTDAVLEPEVLQSFALDPATGGFRTFRIDVPENARALRVDITEVSSDLDLYARRGAPMTSLENCAHLARHDWGRETLLVTRESDPPLAPGPWFVDVLDALSLRTTIPFEIEVRFVPEPPKVLLDIPQLPQLPPTASPLARALPCVVELFSGNGGGSGTLLTHDGLILTNAHVVAGPDNEPVPEVVIALSLDPKKPSVELMRGAIARYDFERDLALVQPTRGFYGQPLPAGYRFPALSLGDPQALAIGDPLWVVGYPILGGTGSRVAIHCSRGVVSGFDQEPFGLVFKTDAQVLPGNSGGAALDSEGRLVGIPSSNVSDGTGLIGLVHPLWIVPPEWVETIRARSKE